MENQWQPIETAPKDGTKEILLSNGIDIVLSHFDEDAQIWLYYDNFRECILKYYPTHWMPLPEKPPVINN